MKLAVLGLKLSVKKPVSTSFWSRWSALFLGWAGGSYCAVPPRGRGPHQLPAVCVGDSDARSLAVSSWRSLSDPTMEEAIFDSLLHREFFRLGKFSHVPNESTILRFHHRLEKHKLGDANLATFYELLSSQGLMLKESSAVDVKLVVAPGSKKTKRASATQKCIRAKRQSMDFGIGAPEGRKIAPNRAKRLQAT